MAVFVKYWEKMRLTCTIRRSVTVEIDASAWVGMVKRTKKPWKWLIKKQLKIILKFIKLIKSFIKSNSLYFIKLKLKTKLKRIIRKKSG